MLFVALATALLWPHVPTALGAPDLRLAQGERRDEERGNEQRREPHRDQERRAPPRETEHRYKRGERVVDEDRRREYVVQDWRARRLHAPPSGYRWEAVGPDYLLVAIATGVVSEVLENSAATATAPPGTAAEAPAPTWYYCASSRAYYPNVTQCPEGWQAVPATPPGPPR
jgi:Ni/Co efflux regulator RcnB